MNDNHMYLVQINIKPEISKKIRFILVNHVYYIMNCVQLFRKNIIIYVNIYFSEVIKFKILWSPNLSFAQIRILQNFHYMNVNKWAKKILWRTIIFFSKKLNQQKSKWGPRFHLQITRSQHLRLSMYPLWFPNAKFKFWILISFQNSLIFQAETKLTISYLCSLLKIPLE